MRPDVPQSNYTRRRGLIGIVGGGITGLVLAHELDRRNAEYVLLEGRAEPGGVMRSRNVGGHVLDLGPQRTRLTPSIASLVDELGLRDRLRIAPELPLHVYRRGRLRRVPFSVREALRTDLFSWTEKLRILAEPLTAAARADETVARFLTRKFGKAAYLHMLGPLYGGLYASDPADMPLAHSLARALEQFGLKHRSILIGLAKMRGRRGAAPPACSFDDGMQELPRALADAHAARIRLSTPVLRIERAADGFRLTTEAASLAVKRVVLTVPAPAAAELLREVEPDAAARLSTLRYNPLALVHLRSDCEIPGFGYQTSFAESLETRGVTFNASIFGRTGIYTAYLGGASHPELVEWPEDRIGEVAAGEFRIVTGREAVPLLVHRTHVPAWDRSWSALEGMRLPENLVLAANYESRAGIEGRVARAKEVAARLTA